MDVLSQPIKTRLRRKRKDCSSSKNQRMALSSMTLLPQQRRMGQRGTTDRGRPQNMWPQAKTTKQQGFRKTCVSFGVRVRNCAPALGAPVSFYPCAPQMREGAGGGRAGEGDFHVVGSGPQFPNVKGQKYQGHSVFLSKS